MRLIRPSPTVRLSDREECAQHTHTHTLTPDNTQRQKYQRISKLSSGIDFTHWSQSARSILQCIGSEPTIKGTNCYFRSGLLWMGEGGAMTAAGTADMNSQCARREKKMEKVRACIHLFGTVFCSQHHHLLLLFRCVLGLLPISPG